MHGGGGLIKMLDQRVLSVLMGHQTPTPFAWKSEELSLKTESKLHVERKKKMKSWQKT